MAMVICHHKGCFNVYNSSWDTFAFSKSVGINTIKDYVKEQEGLSGLHDFDEKVELAKKQGIGVKLSMSRFESLNDMLSGNVAGTEGETLEPEECIQRFLS